eukprot:Gb_41460 [translate_table: standard]
MKFNLQAYSIDNEFCICCDYIFPMAMNGVKVVGGSIDEDYELGPEIGFGSETMVRICHERKTRVPFCCKTLHKAFNHEKTKKEVEIMSRLSGHPGLVELHAVYEDLISVHLIMELCRGGSLSEIMKRNGSICSENEAAQIMKGVIEGIGYCHSKGVMHRDIKLDNIFVSPDTVPAIKLGDFGLATYFEKGRPLIENAGTPRYVAPEMFEDLGYLEGVDVWSAGVCLYEMLCGSPPFAADSLHTIRKNVLYSDPDLSSGIWSHVSDSCKDLIWGMLNKNANCRLSVTQVLNHPWLINRALP